MSFDRNALADALAMHGTIVRVVVAEVRGSAPRETGTAMLIWDGGQQGSIGGGNLEHDATTRAREMLARGEARAFVRFSLGPDLGQCCGGAVALLFERFETLPETLPETGAVFARRVDDRPDAGGAPPDTTPPLPALRNGWFLEPVGTPTTEVWIWGAGHVGRALVHVLAPVPGLAVTLVDTAPDRLPGTLPANVTPRVADPITDALPEAPPQAHHFILTYSHEIDLALCDSLLGHGFASAGLIGSATKWARFRARLADRAHSPAAIARIRCPIGTPGLGKAPGAIAVGAAHALLLVVAGEAGH